MSETYDAIIRNCSQTRTGQENLFLLILQLTEESKKWQEKEVFAGLKKLSYLRSSILKIAGTETDQFLIQYYQRLVKMIDQAIGEKEEAACQKL